MDIKIYSNLMIDFVVQLGSILGPSWPEKLIPSPNLVFFQAPNEASELIFSQDFGTTWAYLGARPPQDPPRSPQDPSKRPSGTNFEGFWSQLDPQLGAKKGQFSAQSLQLGAKIAIAKAAVTQCQNT